MTDTPDDLPSPDEYLRKMAHVDREFADARRYLSALMSVSEAASGVEGPRARPIRSSCRTPSTGKYRRSTRIRVQFGSDLPWH